MRLRLAAMARPNRGEVGGANHAACAALDRRLALAPDGRRGARGGSEALRARGHGERRRPPRPRTLRAEASTIGALTKGQDARRPCARPPRPPQPPANSSRGESSPPPRSPRRRRTRPTGSPTRSSRSRPTTPRRTTATSSSAAARPRPTPPTSIRRRPRRRPWRWRVARRSSRPPRDVAPALDALHASLDRRDNARRAQDLRGNARGARLPHPRLQGRQRIGAPARLLQLLRPARAQDRFRALCRGFRRVEHGDLRPRTSSSASRASSTASAMRSCCARACPRRSANQLLKSADYEIYVRDRSPQAHFAGKAYVLPRQGQQGAPLVTVNTAKVAIDVYRIGDRNLLGDRQPRRFPQADRLIARAGHREPGRRRRSGAARWTSPPSSTRTS